MYWHFLLLFLQFFSISLPVDLVSQSYSWIICQQCQSTQCSAVRKVTDALCPKPANTSQNIWEKLKVQIVWDLTT